MRSFVGIAIVIVAAAPVRAEVTKLGAFTLGQEVKKPATVKTTVYGCTGELRPQINKAKKVVKVKFDGGKCKVGAIVAAITKAHGGAPIANAHGDKLWEGKTASIILDAGHSAPVVLLVPPGPGSKRTCFADDGFAAFWSTFKAAVATGNPATIAASFKFPLKDFEGKVKIKDAKAFATQWTEVIDNDDAKEIAGDLEATCRVDADKYELSLPGTYSELTATKVKRAWLWTSLDSVSPD